MWEILFVLYRKNYFSGNFRKLVTVCVCYEGRWPNMANLIIQVKKILVTLSQM